MTELLRLKSGHDLRSRLFISHASEDHEIAKTICRKLSSRQISVWIDSERLTPGTPDWERAIRAGIAQSVAVVVLASPHSQASRYVRAELAIAQSQKLPIVPAWVSGDDWPDCIAMDLISSQYIDIRGERQDVGIGRLIEELILICRKSLPDHILLDEADVAITEAKDNHSKITYDRPPAPPGFMTVLFKKLETEKSGRASVPGVLVRIGKYEVIGQLLDDIYQQYLADQFDPQTYGFKWLLEGSCSWDEVVLAPWTYLTKDRTNEESLRSWKRNTLIDDCGLLEASPWTVMDWTVMAPQERNLYGVGATNKRLIWSVVGRGEKARYFALDAGIFRYADPNELDKSGVSYVIGCGRTMGRGRVIIQADCDDQKVEQFLKYSCY